MKKVIYLLIIFLISNLSLASEFKKIKKEAVVTNSKIIFPIKSNEDTCVASQLLQPNFILDPIPTLDAPKGYGLDDRFDQVRQQFERFSMPCGLGDVKSCEKVKEIILNWAKADAPKRTGPKNGESKFWNDTLTINLHINNPMMSGYSFARQVIDFSIEEENTIKEWFKRSVKRGAHLMYGKKYNDKTGARGVPRSAHNHALTSAISHMQLGIILNDHKLFRKAFKNYEHAIRYQRKNGSLPIEVRRGGRAMFYQGRVMNALSVIAIIAENQGYNIWEYNHKGKGKNFHNLVKFFLDFSENNEIVFKYAKEMKAPGPAKDYKNQDLKVKNSSNWGWLYAYATRFPNHENIKRIEEWANEDNLNKYQIGFLYHYKNIGKTKFNDASWTVVEANCHFLK
ncbi:alginate lyase family protein [Candidatus Pelagibacter ubique]|nr:alginate lyase family protein [Candidatus Pelagibacter ubique]